MNPCRGTTARLMVPQVETKVTSVEMIFGTSKVVDGGRTVRRSDERPPSASYLPAFAGVVGQWLRLVDGEAATAPSSLEVAASQHERTVTIGGTMVAFDEPLNVDLGSLKALLTWKRRRAMTGTSFTA